ncbi:hypothetical protein N7540_010727 [Penicillium herquei]|nr:hypothetical protein N7540_010727 [Penicillium herquei]
MMELSSECSPASLTPGTSHLEPTPPNKTRAPFTPSEPLLVVPLANFTEQERKTLISRVQSLVEPPRKVEVWIPRPGSLHIPLQPRSRYFVQPIPDSKAHIYELAILLHRLGYSKFFVADGLTLRQLQGDCRHGEEEVLSVVLVNIKQPTRNGSIKNYFESLSPLVFAKRRAVGIDSESDSHSDEEYTGSSEEWSGTDAEDEDDEDELSYEDSLASIDSIEIWRPKIAIDIPSKSAEQILDADQDLFTLPTVLSTGRWNFENNIASALPNSLPPELKAEIVSYLKHRILDRSYLMGWRSGCWPGRVNEEHPITILLAFPTTPSQFQRLQNAMAQHMKRIFELIMSKHPPLSERHESLKWAIQLLIRLSQCTSEECSPEESIIRGLTPDDYTPEWSTPEDMNAFSLSREEELPLDQFHVRLVPWPYNQPATRRDLQHHYRGGRFDVRHYLLRCPFSSSSDEELLENSELATLQTIVPGDVAEFVRAGKRLKLFAEAVRNSFTGIVRQELLRTIEWRDLEPLKPKEFPLYQMICEERLSDLDEPLYEDPLPWIPIWQPNLAGSRFPALPLFYLTNSFSDDDLDNLEDTLWDSFEETPPEWAPKQILHIPWKKADKTPNLPDGTLHDIWNIFWDITSLEYYYCYLPLFFVDSRTCIDGTVIVVSEWETLKSYFQAGQEDLLRGITRPLTRGMFYGRIFLESICLFNNALHNDWGRTPLSERPDWPGNGIIPDLEI